MSKIQLIDAKLSREKGTDVTSPTLWHDWCNDKWTIAGLGNEKCTVLASTIF